MKDQLCPFCAIVRGTEPAHVIYEDDQIIAFLDARPINPGHTLVIPKQHVPDFYQLADALYGEVLLEAKHLAKVIAQVTQPTKVGLVIAGFDVPHTHVHVVPMHDYHDITSRAFADPDRILPDETQLQAMAQRLRAEME